MYVHYTVYTCIVTWLRVCIVTWLHEPCSVINAITKCKMKVRISAVSGWVTTPQLASMGRGPGAAATTAADLASLQERVSYTTTGLQYTMLC
jgi:hypothetical protein